MKETEPDADDRESGDLQPTEAFAPPDITELSTHIRVEARAVEEGKSDVPSPLGEYPSEVEQDILEELKRRARKAEEDYTARRRLCDERVARGAVNEARQATMKAAGEKTLAEFKAETALDAEYLRPFADRVAEWESGVASFKERHDLQRPPRTLSPRERLALWLLLGVVALAQLLVNGAYLADLGGRLIGGGARTLALSFVNVVAAAVYGRWGLPLVLHRRASAKALGIALLLGFVVWVAGLSLSVGHFRDLWIENEGTVSIPQLLERIANAHVNLAHADSGLLALLVGVLGIAAAACGFRLGESYPGFGTVAKGRDRAYAELARERRVRLDALTRRRDRALEDLNAALEAVESARDDRRRAEEERADLHRGYVACLDHLAGLNRRLTAIYRDENRKSRFIAAPAYFNAPVPRPGFLDAEPLPPVPEPERDLYSEVVSLFEHYIGQIEAEYQQALPRYTEANESEATQQSDP